MCGQNSSFYKTCSVIEMEFELNLFYIHEYREIRNIYKALDKNFVRKHKLYNPGYCDELLSLDNFESL